MTTLEASPSIGRATVAVRRLAAIVLLGGLCLTVTAVPVSAQSLVGGGVIYGNANCYMATKTAGVSVSLMQPAALASSGAYYYTQVWAKARFESTAQYNLIGGVYSPLIKTWSQYNPNPFVSGQLSWMNNPTTIFSTSFSGNVEAYYDIHIMWWTRLPGTTQWSGPFSFNLASDRDSLITNYSNNGFGNLGTHGSSDCYL